ncbi:MAG: hypothetical protein ABGZ53_20115 [Fuerstiella sp.]
MSVRFTLLFILFAFSADPAHGQRADEERSALGGIFGQVQVVESAVAVVEQAHRLNAEERYRFLATWVLPNNDHHDLRLTVGFTPTGAPERLDSTAGSEGIRRPVGGVLASPVTELMKVAVKLDRLPEVREQIAQSSRDDVDSQITRLAGLVLVDCASGQLSAAEQEIAELYEIVAAHQKIEDVWQGPLLLAVQSGSGNEVSVAAAQDLVFDVVQTEISNIGPGDWRSFQRQLMLLAEQCIVQLSRKPALPRGAGLVRNTNAKVGDQTEDDVVPQRALGNIRHTDNGLT